jgi:hypothetical protein
MEKRFIATIWIMASLILTTFCGNNKEASGNKSSQFIGTVFCKTKLENTPDVFEIKERSLFYLTPKGTLETFGVAGAPIYLTEINFITKDDSILQDFTDSYSYIGYIGNGDYFVTFKIIDGHYPCNYVVKKYIMHIIPEKNTSTFEIQFVSDTDYENEISEEGEIMYGWLFGWATEDELSDHQYIKIYEYVKDWKKQAKKKN